MTHPISRYLNVRAAYHPSFAADGRRLAFLSSITGRSQVWQVELMPDSGTIPWPDQLTFAADRVMGVKCSPAPGDNRLLYGHDVGGNENAQLFLLDPDTGRERCLTEGYEAAMHIPGQWSPDGRHLLFAANRRHPALFDLYLQPMDGGQARLVWQHDEPGYLAGHVLAPNGRFATVIRASASFHHDLFQIDLETGEARQLNPPQKQARFTNIDYSKDGRFLYVNTDLDSDFLHVAQLDLVTLDWETLVSPNWDTELLTRSPNGRYLAYAVNQHGASQLELIDLSMGLARTAVIPDQAPGVVGWFDGRLAFSADSDRLAFSYTGATRTADIYVWDLDLNQDTVRPVTRSSHGGIPTDSFVAPELVRYPTFDEREIPAWFYRPAAARGDSSLPTVVIVHGGPESQYRPYFNFLAQYFVHHGYAVLAPNVRGSTGYGKAYSHLDDVEKRMDSVADLAHAARWLGEQPHVDAARIAVYGGSYGGFMVLAALTNYPDLWAAGVNVVGISNFVSFLENTSDYRRGHREAEYGSLENERDFLESIAPMRQIEQITAPLMVIHGANDPRVPLSEAQQLVEALKVRDVPVEFLVFDDEGHGIVKRKNKLSAYPAVVEFLQRYV
jgi:dipeptidyl aminopeptidase/acylaminoacyl peptidase